MSNTPESIFDAVIRLSNEYGSTEKFKQFSAMPENKAVSYSHHGIGRWIRNNWGFWKQEGELYNIFKKKGLEHPDDMSSVILTCLHRHLNGKIDWDIPGQVNHYIKYWKEQNESTTKPNS